jgi:beta-glucanase (GH16 family)
MEFLYGRIETRLKVPKGRGTWPAFWMLGTNIEEVGWPHCGELDIMEYVGYDPNVIHANIHCQAFNHINGTNKGDSVKISNPYEEFHVYAMEWCEDRIDFFVDETKYFSFKKPSDNVEEWPFDKPQFLIINLAIGGNWGGKKGIDDSLFPHKYYVDYVRYYKRSQK